MSGRATWKAAVGTERGQYKLWNGTVQTSAKSGGHKTLKYRKTGQNNAEEVKRRDLSLELRNKEAGVDPLLNIAAAAAAAAAAALASHGAVSTTNQLDRDDDSDDAVPTTANTAATSSGRMATAVDADDHSESGEASSSSSSSSDSDSDDASSQDETAELMRELARIKQEREQERAKLEQERLIRDAADNEAAVLRSNPLLNADQPRGELASDSVVKRKWHEETTFKNQAKVDDPKKPKRFINDTIRSDFHIRFLERYVK